MHTKQPQDAETTDSLPPFHPQNPSADVVIRCSDSVDFFVHKAIISFASPFFRTLLEEGVPPSRKNGLAVVVVEEDCSTVRHLMLFCYPPMANYACAVESPEQAKALGAAARKYSMEEVEARLTAMVLRSPLVQADPLRWYAIGITSRWESIARAAARQSLRLPIRYRKSVPEYQDISALALHALLEYHWKSADSVNDILTQRRTLQPDDESHRWLSWLGNSEVWLWKWADKCAGKRDWIYTTVIGPTSSNQRGATHASLLVCVDKVAERLKETPGADVLESCSNELAELNESLAGCKNHRTSLSQDMRAFIEKLQRAIDDAITQVCVPSTECSMLNGRRLSWNCTSK